MELHTGYTMTLLPCAKTSLPNIRFDSRTPGALPMSRPNTNNNYPLY